MKPQRTQQTIFTDVMVDLETLGTVPGCVVLSIGAVAFNAQTGELGPEFYIVVNTDDCISQGLHINEDTMDWWEKQSEEARQVLIEAGDKDKSIPLARSLNEFNDYLYQVGLKQVKIWGNGADFDNAILACCYNALGRKVPWSPWNGRCYRTLKNLIEGPSLKREGTYHNALDDAKSQALHAMQLLK